MRNLVGNPMRRQKLFTELKPKNNNTQNGQKINNFHGQQNGNLSVKEDYKPLAPETAVRKHRKRSHREAKCLKIRKVFLTFPSAAFGRQRLPFSQAQIRRSEHPKIRD